MGLFNLLKKAVDVSTEVATTAIYAVGEEQKAASDLKHQKESAERNQEEKRTVTIKYWKTKAINLNYEEKTICYRLPSQRFSLRGTTEKEISPS